MGGGVVANPVTRPVFPQVKIAFKSMNLGAVCNKIMLIISGVDLVLLFIPKFAFAVHL